MANRKKKNPTVTHLEILCLAIRSVERDIGEWRMKCEGRDDDYFQCATADLSEKLETLKMLYRIESGCDYAG